MDFGHGVKVWYSCCNMGIDFVLWQCENVWCSCRFIGYSSCFFVFLLCLSVVMGVGLHSSFGKGREVQGERAAVGLA